MLPTPLENILRKQITSLQGDDFQSFITELMFFRYGASDFNTLRRRKDKGADGIIQSKQAVIACWGPEIKPLNKLQKPFEKKVGTDLVSYQNNWADIYPNWIVVTNHEPAPSELRYVSTLKPSTPIWGANEILHIIGHEISYANRRKIFAFLKIPNEYISQDILAGLLEDILSVAESDATIAYQGAPMYLPDKIQLNFNLHDIDSIQQEIWSLEEDYFEAIQSALGAFEDTELTKIKGKLIFDYNMAQGNSFAEKLNNMTMQYLHKYAADGDDEIRRIIRGLLFLIFEQCLIGAKTAAEKNQSSK
jgi:hypothetical protein